MQCKGVCIAAILFALVAVSTSKRDYAYSSSSSSSCVCNGHYCSCKKSCNCGHYYHPVCGKNGKTYNNSCLAKCAGTSVKCNGKCPCKPTCVKENGDCLKLNSVGKNPFPKKCCPGLKCCAKYSIGSHNSISGVCKHWCGPKKG